ncbi:hypothetical protein E2C01_068849 [Portunus trituberculatus]|uniref:Uncharacterized protein n=1 Tax=Portunus trituberculatus TaxID=210409 RepID=A0A5B7HXT7_PORTR|nr:hypothetical protein [Portunus trituberculatus]
MAVVVGIVIVMVVVVLVMVVVMVVAALKLYSLRGNRNCGIQGGVVGFCYTRDWPADTPQSN